MRPRSSARRLVPVLAVALVALAACREEAQEVVKAPDPVVRVTTIQPATAADSDVYTGVVRPRVSVPEGFRVAGKVVERLVDVGETVKAGDVIARLDTVDLALAVERSEASRAAAEVNLRRAEADARRTRDLLAKGHATPADLDGRDLAVAEATSRLENETKGLELARNQLGYATLKASRDGVVSAVSAEAGQVVAVGTPVVTLAGLGETEVAVAIPESRLAVLEAAKAEVSLWAGGRLYAAKLREVSPEADPATRTYAARFSIVDADAAVRLGMTATLRLLKDDPTPVVRLPATALLDEGRGPVVFTVDAESRKLAKVPVEVARYDSDDVLVRTALPPGTQVVALGVERLTDGGTVRPLAAN